MAAKKKIESTKTKKKSTETLKTNFTSFVKQNNLYIAIIVALIIGALYYFRGLFIAATVNGQPISRLTVIKELEDQGGQDVLESLVSRSLILQEAKKRNVQATDSEINVEIENYRSGLQEQGQDLESALSLQGTTMATFREQIRYQILIEKMFGQDVEVTEDEINQYIEENESYLPETENEEELKTLVTDQLKQQKISENFQNWLSQARQDASIKYLVNYGG